MDCGDAGHILVSKRVADDLAQDSLWQPLLHELGEIEVKHGVRLGVVNLYTEELGNPQPPKKLSHRPVPVTQPVASAESEIAPSVPEKSIAVLPFENLSADPENAFFVDGVHDEILTDLARIADLKVISRTSVMQYKTAAKRNLREIADELGVAHILEGSVQRAGNRVRLRAQLIDARTDVHLWAEGSIDPSTMSLPSRATLPKPSQTSSKPSFHALRKRRLSSLLQQILSRMIVIFAV
jgi:TolB-like protein